MRGSHRPAARAGRGNERWDTLARVLDGWGHGKAGPAGQRHGASKGAGADKH
jgi:hypothetical protein